MVSVPSPGPRTVRSEHRPLKGLVDARTVRRGRGGRRARDRRSDRSLARAQRDPRAPDRWQEKGYSCLIHPLSLFAGQRDSHVSRQGKSIDPMNRPMDELGVTGHDSTLCSDRWYSCTSYDRQQFDQKYPGRQLNDLLRYGEPDWPDRDRSDRSADRSRTSSDRYDRLDKSLPR